MPPKRRSTSKPNPRSKPRKPRDRPTIPPPREPAAKAKRTVTAASGAGVGAAAPSRVKAAAHLARKMTRCASRAKPWKALLPTMAMPKKTKAMNSRAWFAAIRLPMASGARRGGRRRRGNGPEDGLAGSIADELGPTSAPEAASAVADFDGGSFEPAPSLVEPEPVSLHAEPQPAEPQPAAYARPDAYAQPESVETVTASTAPAAPTAEETAQEADRAAARRRSTVREKVSFMTSAQAEPAPPVIHSAPEPVAPPEPAPAEPAPASTGEAAPRKAGWWSRRFGGGE